MREETLQTMSSLLLRLALFLGIGMVLWGVESVWPLRSRPPQRQKAYGSNVVLTGLVLAVNFGLAGVTASILALVKDHRLGFLQVANAPGWLMALVGIAGLDFFAYLAHVAMHKTQFGWRFHQVHHSDPHVDVTTALRQHPGETLVRFGFQLAGSLVLGVSPAVFGMYIAVSALNAQLEHANICLPEKIDRLVRLLLVTPNLHKLHHSISAEEANLNYANIFSVWDRLFGTFGLPTGLGSIVYGLDGREETGCTGLLAMPFQRT